VREHEEAAGLYREALGLDERNAVNWFNLGVSYEKLGRREPATRAYEKAAAIATENAGFRAALEGMKDRNPSGQYRKVEAGVHHIGGFRDEPYFSLPWNRDCYDGRIPAALIWINDDPFGDANCLGVAGEHRGRVYFWDHENEPDEDWDGSVEMAGNLTLVANSFTEYVAGLRELDDAS
jgi:tetratricopeptide (TPR) repeat protein